MTDNNTQRDQAALLRQRAEEKALNMAEPDTEALSSEETRSLPHELRVHQIELELQNEKLRRAQAEPDASRAHYEELYEFAPVGYCTISEKG